MTVPSLKEIVETCEKNLTADIFSKQAERLVKASTDKRFTDGMLHSMFSITLQNIYQRGVKDGWEADDDAKDAVVESHSFTRRDLTHS